MKRTKVSLSSYKLFSGKMGYLIPSEVKWVLPGDSFRDSSTYFTRMQPLNTPVMHPVHIRTVKTFTPLRLLWDNWEKFITGGPDGDFVTPTPKIALTNATTGIGTLNDFLGDGGQAPPGPAVYDQNAFLHRCYAKNYNDLFRDQDIIDPVGLSTADGPDTTTNTSLLKIAWTKDRFTSARPEPQKGDAVSVPLSGDPSLSGTARVSGIGKRDQTFDNGTVNAYQTDGIGTVSYTSSQVIGDSAADRNLYVEEDPNNAGYLNIRAQLEDINADVDLDDVGTLIQDIRDGVAIQRFRDRMMRAGSRYTEYLKSSFGVRSSDARLQRPEILSMSSETIQFSEVLQTSPSAASGTTGTDGVGDLYGHGIGTLKTNKYQRFFEEHGIVMTFFVIQPLPLYTEGIDRHWLADTREDFYDKDLHQVGEVEVLNKEVMSTHASPTGRFGWQRRYYHYFNQLSGIAGKLRTTLDTWHLGRDLPTNVSLNEDFINCSPDTRIFQDTTDDHFIVMARNSVQARRAILNIDRPTIL